MLLFLLLEEETSTTVNEIAVSQANITDEDIVKEPAEANIKATDKKGSELSIEITSVTEGNILRSIVNFSVKII